MGESELWILSADCKRSLTVIVNLFLPYETSFSYWFYLLLISSQNIHENGLLSISNLFHGLHKCILNLVFSESLRKVKKSYMYVHIVIRNLQKATQILALISFPRWWLVTLEFGLDWVFASESIQHLFT